MSMSGTLASTLIQLIRNWRLDAWMTVRYCRSLGMKASMLKSELAVTMSCRGRCSQGSNVGGEPHMQVEMRLCAAGTTMRPELTTPICSRARS